MRHPAVNTCLQKVHGLLDAYLSTDGDARDQYPVQMLQSGGQTTAGSEYCSNTAQQSAAAGSATAAATPSSRRLNIESSTIPVAAALQDQKSAVSAVPSQAKVAAALQHQRSASSAASSHVQMAAALQHQKSAMSAVPSEVHTTSAISAVSSEAQVAAALQQQSSMVSALPLQVQVAAALQGQRSAVSAVSSRSLASSSTHGSIAKADHASAAAVSAAELPSQNATACQLSSEHSCSQGVPDTVQAAWSKSVATGKWKLVAQGTGASTAAMQQSRAQTPMALPSTCTGLKGVRALLSPLNSNGPAAVAASMRVSGVDGVGDEPEGVLELLLHVFKAEVRHWAHCTQGRR